MHFVFDSRIGGTVRRTQSLDVHGPHTRANARQEENDDVVQRRSVKGCEYSDPLMDPSSNRKE